MPRPNDARPYLAPSDFSRAALGRAHSLFARYSLGRCQMIKARRDTEIYRFEHKQYPPLSGGGYWMRVAIDVLKA